MQTEMMALKALISRKWKLGNCSAERERDRGRAAREPDRKVASSIALKPNQI